MDIPQDMLDHANEVLTNAYSPYSKLKIGACLRSQQGELFVGCNVENAAYPLSICAEMAAITNMVSTSGHTVIKEIVIASKSNELVMPCGACRQCLNEFCKDDITVYAICNIKQVKLNLSELLPFSFNKTQLRNK